MNLRGSSSGRGLLHGGECTGPLRSPGSGDDENALIIATLATHAGARHVRPYGRLRPPLLSAARPPPPAAPMSNILYPLSFSGTSAARGVSARTAQAAGRSGLRLRASNLRVRHICDAVRDVDHPRRRAGSAPRASTDRDADRAGAPPGSGLAIVASSSATPTSHGRVQLARE